MGRGAIRGGNVSAAQPEPQTEQKRNPWAEYERRKRALPDDLSNDDRDEQLRKIADELGI